VTFEADVNAYPALTKLKELDDQGQLELHEAVIVERADDGSLTIKGRAGTDKFEGMAGGGLLGLLVGILGGPIGVLIGGTYGMLVGSLFDLDDAERTESTLGQISESVKPGRTAVLAVVTEPSPEVVDAAMTPFGGTALRRSVYEVEAEVAAIEQAERKAKHEAQKELMRSRREETRETVHAKVDELKAKLAPGSRS
jgi:uncharacterized membrane protein